MTRLAPPPTHARGTPGGAPRRAPRRHLSPPRCRRARRGAAASGSDGPCEKCPSAQTPAKEKRKFSIRAVFGLSPRSAPARSPLARGERAAPPQGSATCISGTFPRGKPRIRAPVQARRAGHPRQGAHARCQLSNQAAEKQNPTGAACAAALRFLRTLARAGSLRAASGRFLKTLGQNLSSWREIVPVAPHFPQPGVHALM